MHIDIKQQKISLADKFEISTDDNPTHHASSELFRLLPVFNLYKKGISDAWLTVSKQWTIFLSRYDIKTYAGDVLQFRSTSFWKPCYQCQAGADLYEVFGHMGRKHSVFKNGKQVAWWDKNAVSVFNGNEYSITADFDCNVELIIAFCIIIHDMSGDDGDGTVNIDFGNIGPVARKFDDTWIPRGG